MASTRKRTTKDGQTFYEIRVSCGRGKSYLTTPLVSSGGLEPESYREGPGKGDCGV